MLKNPYINYHSFNKNNANDIDNSDIGTEDELTSPHYIQSNKANKANIDKIQIINAEKKNTRYFICLVCVSIICLILYLIYGQPIDN